MAVGFPVENVSAGRLVTQRNGDALGSQAEMGSRKRARETLGLHPEEEFSGNRGRSCGRSKSKFQGPEWKTRKALKNHLPVSHPRVRVSSRKYFCRLLADMKGMEVATREGGEGLRKELGGSPRFTPSSQKKHS